MSTLAAPSRVRQRREAAFPRETARPRGNDQRTAPRALAFCALATFAGAHWSVLVVDPPLAGVALVAVVATGAGLAIARLSIRARRRWAAALARVTIAALAGAAALVALGLPPALLVPAGWPELVAGIDRGLAGLRKPEWPYAGPDQWVRQTILLAAPAAIVIAAALAFWPARRLRPVLRAGSLALLVGLYAAAVAQHEPVTPLAGGCVLLALLAAWLFLPWVRRRDAPAALATLFVAAVVALPVAAGFDGARPLLDYREWRPFGGGVSFEWGHRYGPLEWPRRGHTVLTVASARPHYWKAVTLDRFDGARWVRSPTSAGPGTATELPATVPDRWEVEATVTVRTLESAAVVAPGPIRAVHGVDPALRARDGTARTAERLPQGETYTVRAYAPDPSARLMRAAPNTVPESVRPYTAIGLPARSTSADVLDRGPVSGAAHSMVTLAPWGGPAEDTAMATRRVLGSPYARAYRLARRLAAPAPTKYDAVRRIEAFLRGSFRYGERPPERTYPLAAFLLRDRTGYCQQFSGAMALMLRMNGIPARVAAGFAPGARQGSEFTVRDLDAHSWVEVWFGGIGWVPFDPTPPDAPAGSRTDGSTASAARGSEGRSARFAAAGLSLGAAGGEPEAGSSSRPTPGSAPAGRAGDGIDRLPVAGALLAAVACATLVAVIAGRRARRGADAEVEELRAALERFGEAVPARTTLLELERRLGDARRPQAAGYVRGLRERRYGQAAGRPVEASGRAAIRRALTAGDGLRGTVRGYLAVPPRRR